MTFECEPGTLKLGKLKTIKAIGVTRLSLGVEHFDDEVLSINGRAHKSPEIRQAYAWARDVGFEQINVDLIAGMLGETDDKWKSAVAQTLALDADSVTIYQMEVPFNTTIAKEARAHGGESPVANWETKRRWVDYAFQQFEAAGYVVSSGYTLVKPQRHAGFVYRDSLWRGADLIGTGVASFGHFQGVHYQNVDTWENYIALLDRGELPINRALPVTDRQRLIREMVLQLKTGHLDAAYFRGKFGVEIADEFREGFASITARGPGARAGRRSRTQQGGAAARGLAAARVFRAAISARTLHMTPEPQPSLADLAGAREALAHLLAPFAPGDAKMDGEPVDPEAMPVPWRGLLVHHNHMTLELQRHYGSPVEVHVQREVSAGDIYTRKVGLTLAGTRRFVEWGIARLDFRYLSPAVRADILAKKIPLGAVLIGHRVHRRVEPLHYIRFPAGSGTIGLFAGAANREAVFGRIGIIYCDDEPAIELLEVVVDTEQADNP